VTLDGVPQNDPFGGWVIWTALPPEGLSGVSLVRGAGAGPYGAGALTGVAALSELAVGSSSQRLDLGLTDDGSARGALALTTDHLVVTAGAERREGYVPVRKGRGPADNATNLEARSLSARLQGEAEGVRMALRVSAYDEARDAGLVGAASHASGTSASVSLAQPSADGLGWRAQAWVRSSDLENTSVAVGAGRLTTTPANDQYATPALGYGLNGALQGRSGDLAWELGGDVRLADGEVRERFRVISGAFTRNRVAGGRTAIGGVYAEGAWTSEDWVLGAGLRVDAWQQTDAHRQERDLATGASLLSLSPSDTSGTTPTARLALRRQVTDGLFVRGAAYGGFRPPSLNELHRPFRVGNDVTEANSALRPETLKGLEVGLGGEGWSATLFATRLEDPITNVTLGSGPASFPVAGFIPAGGVLRQRQNAGQIEAWGLEADWARTLGAVDLKAGLTYSHARVDGGMSAPQLTGKRPAQVPSLTLTSQVTWQASEDLGLSGGLRYESARFEDDLNSRKLSAALSLDGRVDWDIGAGRKLYLAVENLSDAAIEVGETGDGIESFAAPRRVTLGLTLRR
jgi:outer membrane receptor protein involved in Fe transport